VADLAQHREPDRGDRQRHQHDRHLVPQEVVHQRHPPRAGDRHHPLGIALGERAQDGAEDDRREREAGAAQDVADHAEEQHQPDIDEHGPVRERAEHRQHRHHRRQYALPAEDRGGDRAAKREPGLPCLVSS
jgi:hypothetical protein